VGGGVVDDLREGQVDRAPRGGGHVGGGGGGGGGGGRGGRGGSGRRHEHILKQRLEGTVIRWRRKRGVGGEGELVHVNDLPGVQYPCLELPRTKHPWHHHPSPHPSFHPSQAHCWCGRTSHPSHHEPSSHPSFPPSLPPSPHPSPCHQGLLVLIAAVAVGHLPMDHALLMVN